MQKRNVLLGSLVALATSAAISSTAHAAGNYVDSAVAKNYLTCPGSGAVWPGANSFVSYFADSATQLPSTGDLGYMRATTWNLNACTPGVNDSSSHMYITLPDTVSLAISAVNPVRCYVGNTTGMFEEVTSSFCTQSPTQAAFGLDFGSRALPAGWFFEVRFPVSYNRWNGSITNNRKLRVITVSDFGMVFPELVIPINYRPKFDNVRLTANSNGFDATVAFDVTTYNEWGNMYVVYSTDPTMTTNNFQRTVSVQTTASNFSYTNNTVTLTGLTPAVRYYWRVVMANNLGGFGMSAIQSFDTPPASIYVPAPSFPCRRFAC